ncbi:SRPBCC domain-containing protein [Kitasatospora sp. NPDC057904]|uniref:SRPBCC domain-containing protein n=1 Tax=unclassified Kitasatospora TaxID=2633591 RepID=UPI0036DA0077
MTPAAVRTTVYLHATPERVWHALTSADESAVYWGHRNVSTWLPGAPWEHRRTDDSGTADVTGTVEASTRPHHLVTTWYSPGTPDPAGPSRVTFGIEGWQDLTRLTVTHENLADETGAEQAAAGWSAVLANLKTYLETGHPLPQQPWLMP